jgi:hypothetical protein
MRDFSKTTLAALARKGIRVLSAQAAPAFDGDAFFSGSVYKLDQNGRHIIRSHSEVLGMAR